MPGARTIKVDYLPRIEGEASLYIRLTGNRATEVKLSVFEPPRLFEALLQGRSYAEVPDIVARICGICPVAYQMSAVQAIEKLFGIAVEPGIAQLRRLLYCGEWIESHALHIYMLHAPDFLGYPDVTAMAKDHRERVQLALSLKRAGNDLVQVVGAREIHPINVRVGGFYRVPDRAELEALTPSLEKARQIAIETVRWVSGFDFPDFEQEYEFVCLRDEAGYPILDGRVVSSRGVDIPVKEYLAHFVERQVAHSNALQSTLRARGSYLTGPMARFNLSFERLSPTVQQLARESGIGERCANPFKSIIVRALETVWACEEALRLIEQYEPPQKPFMDAVPRPGIASHCTEAPRGILFHQYEIDAAGLILSARIVPPTAQNQKRIEDDLYSLAPSMADLDNDALTRRCEQLVRNYDPCISCATHALHVKVERQ